MFKDQLRALLNKVLIELELFPMIATVDEFKRAKAVVESVRIKKRKKLHLTKCTSWMMVEPRCCSRR
nr:putative PEP-binding protein [Entomoplasma sp. MP1]